MDALTRPASAYLPPEARLEMPVQSLRGAAATADMFRRAADAELANARAAAHNGFKIELAARSMTGVLTELTQPGEAR